MVAVGKESMSPVRATTAGSISVSLATAVFAVIVEAASKARPDQRRIAQL